MSSFAIGHIAEAAGCKVQTVRYYEQIGLLPRPRRSEGNQRLYGKQDLERLLFIRHARELGFPLGSIRELLSLSDQPDQPCDEVDRIARTQLAQVKRRLAQLRALQAELQGMIDRCSGGRVADCRIIERLAKSYGD
ncbi:HTH-type transcriptional regulator ZntR [Candidatus Filomicrobium marinum]|uniref:HTH-type transcriptional regulator ZntR n=1 Tax=Candidatus Filomicrobium marinum TaxID=1608628 RepID=A0A0D6JIT5_9HYPH|nr:helix-turn-helix domain-containing protein [Candidatus Filomicrobium marinum]CFX34479.1 HTH-type transcriptional regulator ZntR [Candidatus Filomicrobium marinum]CPR21856.1 HTH-type transcriptional regulator ZntR [Candidatus Filomicrobium marinum]